MHISVYPCRSLPEWEEDCCLLVRAKVSTDTCSNATTHLANSQHLNTNYWNRWETIREAMITWINDLYSKCRDSVQHGISVMTWSSFSCFDGLRLYSFTDLQFVPFLSPVYGGCFTLSLYQETLTHSHRNLRRCSFLTVINSHFPSGQSKGARTSPDAVQTTLASTWQDPSKLFLFP